MELFKSVIERLKSLRVFRTIVVGGVAVVCQTLVFEILGIYLAIVSPSTAVVIGGEVGVFTNFFLNNRYSFGDRAHGSLLYRLLRFHIVVLGSIVIQWLFVRGAEHFDVGFFLIHVAYATGIVVGFVWNYNWYKFWVWQHRAEKPEI